VVEHVSPEQLLVALRDPVSDLLTQPPGLLVVDAVPDGAVDAEIEARLGLLPSVVAGPPGAGCVDVVVADQADLDMVQRGMDGHHFSSVSLAIHLRGHGHRDLWAGLAAESAAYSMLQGGPEHADWLHDAQRPGPGPDAERVRVDRVDDVLLLTLDRPQARNAFDARMRFDLLSGLAVALTDPAVEVVIRGAGPAFCAGGDLAEFGTVDEPVVGHLLRSGWSPGAAIAAIAERVTAHVHGACVGAGIELPAFAHRLVAAPDARFRLPEISMGLIPGAGGTVSIPGRIGRQRTAWMALTGEWLDAETALAWGLVDEVRDLEDRS